MSESDYLSGVPLRLGKIFYPAVRPQFREIKIRRPEALQDVYDFALERDVLEAHRCYQFQKQRLQEEAEERLKKQKEMAEAMQKERLAAEESRKAQLAQQPTPAEFPPPIGHHNSHTKTLQPRICDPESHVKKVPNLATTNLNLSDFESDEGKNPFDSAEMNSINDMAELASIWANLNLPKTD